MTASKPWSAQTLAVWAWAAMALTPAGWFCGLLAIAYSHLGDVTDVSMMIGGVVLFAARVGHARQDPVDQPRAGIQPVGPGHVITMLSAGLAAIRPPFSACGRAGGPAGEPPQAGS